MMLLDGKTFERVRKLAYDNGYPTAVVQYQGAETITDGSRKVPVVWFKVADKMFCPRRAQLIAVSESFVIEFEKPLRYSCSVTTRNGTRKFGVACSSNGRTLSER